MPRGAAIGDALGGATEGWESREIHDHFDGWVEGVVQSIRHQRDELKPFSPFWKGDGHVTDDTLMTRVLVQAYALKRDHLDAHDVERLLVPLIVDETTWIPELDREDLLYHRLFLAEKWLVLKLRYGHADPRDAGVGNIVNCGAAMYIAPVGIANVGDPDGAYAEAIDLTGGAPVELRPRGGRRARGGRRRGDAARARRPSPSSRRAWGSRRTGRARRSRRSQTRRRARRLARRRPRGAASGVRAVRLGRRARTHSPSSNARIPSRLHSIEEVPIALGLLLASGGDSTETMLGGVNYGRDSDSIASMAGSLAGALGSAPRRDWVEEISAASKIDIEEAGRTMAAVAVEIFALDERRFEERARSVAELDAGEVAARG